LGVEFCRAAEGSDGRQPAGEEDCGRQPLLVFCGRQGWLDLDAGLAVAVSENAVFGSGMFDILNVLLDVNRGEEKNIERI